MFWKRKETKAGEVRLPGPKTIHHLPGRHMVIEEKKDPDWVWNLKQVVRPVGEKKAFYCRIFSEGQAAQAGVQVRNWTTLDEHPDLILWEGYYDEKTNSVRRERFAG